MIHHYYVSYGNIFLLVYRKITFISCWLSISLTMTLWWPSLTVKGLLWLFHLPCLASWNPKITTHIFLYYTPYYPWSPTKSHPMIPPSGIINIFYIIHRGAKLFILSTITLQLFTFNSPIFIFLPSPNFQ